MRLFTVLTEEGGLSLEQFLVRRIPAAPLGYLRQLIKKGKITSACGNKFAGDYFVRKGDQIGLPDSARLNQLLSHKPRPASDILYESREILIVAKPAGLAVHATQDRQQDNLTDRLRTELKQRGENFQLAPIHRLDRETSGPVLFGKGKKSCSALGKMFMAGAVTKGYLALVQGEFQGQGTLRGELSAKGKRKLAVTDYRCLGSTTAASLLELHLKTGRQHQIRQQLAAAGHPLFGDRRYRGPCPPQLGRLFLHGRHLAFTDPFSDAMVTVDCPLPEELSAFSKRCDLGPITSD
jgi:RluA family pseudouridine synthase